MLIIVDKKIPEEAKKNLRKAGDLFELESEGIVYDAISGHPDIFLCQFENKVFITPNAPASLKAILEENKIEVISGEQALGQKYPDTTAYNVVITEKNIIHNFRYSDLSLSKALPDHDPVHVSQGYTRCNLLGLKNDHFITSDQGIYRSLVSMGFEVLFVKPDGILLPGMKHGFFGGCCGVFEDKVYLIGSLSHFPEGEKVRDYLSQLEYQVIELYDGQLFDGGGVMFLDNQLK